MEFQAIVLAGWCSVILLLLTLPFVTRIRIIHSFMNMNSWPRLAHERSHIQHAQVSSAHRQQAHDLVPGEDAREGRLYR